MCLIPNPKAREACKHCGKTVEECLCYFSNYICRDLKMFLNFSSSNRSKLSVSELLVMPTQKINYLPKSGKETNFFHSIFMILLLNIFLT